MQQQSGVSSSSLAPSPAETGGKERDENARRRSFYKEEEGEREDGDNNELDRQSWRGSAGRVGLDEEGGERRRSSGGQDERDGGAHPRGHHYRAGVVPSGMRLGVSQEKIRLVFSFEV